MSTATATRDPRSFVSPEVWNREIILLMRDNVMVRDMAERIFGQAIAYLITAMENPNTDMGVGQTVDIGVHTLILDTKVYFEFCDKYNGGNYKHHEPNLVRRRDGTVFRTADILRNNGFEVDEELWSMDSADCSPCNQKAPDSH
ncbi:hypothetical protein DVA86_18775 [Streptomyces armeniacus]|uniref:Uncharacterized protein n=1 Tax=Streptomyces armeniacus TaxID=83291 RepID=A0A345XRW9_9ACTN|nr:hypothetical protein [Streptomyces armeniacus]AXK34385.1 hypothetical protein DVA86_18775 [Streptomyces armeniacus]